MVLQAKIASQREQLRKRNELQASRALKRLSSSDATSSGQNEVLSGMLTDNLGHGSTRRIDQVIEGDCASRERIGLKGMDKVLDKLRASAGVDSGAGAGVKK